jgi:hypothetical protein
MRFRLIWCLMIMVTTMLLPGIASAQTDDARGVVLEAAKNVITLPGYHIRIKYNYQHRITLEDGTVINNYSIQIAEGDATSNGDRHFTHSVQSSDTAVRALAMPVFEVEQILSAGETYVNFKIAGTVYEDQLGIKPGWWRYNDLLAATENNATNIIIQQNAQPDRLVDLLLRDDTILNTTEVESGSLDGRAMRIFDVDLDAVRLLLEATPGTDEEHEQALAEHENLLKASDISLTYRLWIGTDDGLLYRGKGQQRTYIPSQTVGKDSDPKFTTDDHAAIEFVISQQGEPVDIQPPDPALLNEQLST